MSLRFEHYTHYQDLPEMWNQLLPANHALHSSLIAHTQEANCENLNYYYVLTLENNQLVMLSYFQCLHIKTSHFNCKDNAFQQLTLQTIIHTVKPSLLVAGNLFRHDTSFFYFGEHVPYENRAEIYLKTIDYVVAACKPTGVFVKDLPITLAKFVTEASTYTRMENDISMYLNLPAHWSNINDYEKELKRKYAQRYKKVRKQSDKLTVRELTKAEIEANKEVIYALYRQVSDKQLVSMGKLSVDFFATLKDKLGDSYRVFAWYDQSEMLAFSSVILHDDIYDMNYIGFDYDRNQEYSLYFAILLHCVEQSIARSCTKLILGRTALEAKAIVGCKAEYMNGFYKMRNPLINKVFQIISKRFQHQLGESWKERHPFKTTYKQTVDPLELVYIEQ